MNHLGSISLIAAVWTFVVVVLGAYVRLNDAGLSCPDWPGCYGSMVVPQGDKVEVAQALYPNQPLESGKAWLEMAHRYLAGLLGFFVLAIFFMSLRHRAQLPHIVVLSFLLVPLLLFQAVLGMWTVTQMLHPATVVAHLVGGMTILLLIWCLYLKLPSAAARLPRLDNVGLLRVGAILAVVALLLQIALGGWASANYTALVCDTFPGCSKVYALPPSTAFAKIFQLQGAGSDVAAAIHMTHRIGAAVVTTVLVLLAWRSWQHKELRGWVVAIMAALILHMVVAVLNIYFAWPVAMAALHNALAAVLLLATAGLLVVLFPSKAQGIS